MAIVPIFLGSSVYKLFHDLSEAEKNEARAQKISVEAINKMTSAEYQCYQAAERVKRSIHKLANRKKAILSTSFITFLDVYEKIIKIEFREGDGIKELFQSNFNLAVIHEIRDVALINPITMTDRQIIASVLFGGISGSIVKDSEMKITSAKALNKQSDLYKEITQTNIVVMEGLYKHLNQVAEVLGNLNLLFIKSIHYSGELIKKNGYDCTTYRKEDKESLATCINIAKTIKVIIDTPIVDDNDNITQAMVMAMEEGQTVFQKFYSLV